MPPLDLVLRDGTRIPLVAEVTIGRTPDNSVCLQSPSVSRHHCVVFMAGGTPMIGDAGSSHGTRLDGTLIGQPQALSDGSRITLGDVELTVERRRDQGAAGRTLVVPHGRSMVLPAVGAAQVETSSEVPRPRLRSGWALKRLEESEGERRFVLRDLRSDRFLRLGQDEATLIPLLEEGVPLPDLLDQARSALGPTGGVKLARLLAELGDRGLLEGSDDDAALVRPAPWLARLLAPRIWAVRGAGSVIDALYRAGGFLLFTTIGAVAVGAIAVAGVVAFGGLVLRGGATPFVVAGQVSVGAAVFIIGRLAIAGFHELAHGLAMSACGRRVRRAGIKLLLIFPYVFVDTSEAWLEPRRRRIMISLAGPLSDLACGGTCSIIGLVAGGTWGEIMFQLALGAYLGAFFNLNPLLDRDGYHILADMVRQPGLRRRARARFAARLAGRQPAPGDNRGLEAYAVASLVWLLATALFAILMARRYVPRLVAITHHRELVWAGLVVMAIVLFSPVVLAIGLPLAERFRSRRSDPQAG